MDWSNPSCFIKYLLWAALALLQPTLLYSCVCCPSHDLGVARPAVSLSPPQPPPFYLYCLFPYKTLTLRSGTFTGPICQTALCIQLSALNVCSLSSRTNGSVDSNESFLEKRTFAVRSPVNDKAGVQLSTVTTITLGLHWLTSLYCRAVSA